MGTPSWLLSAFGGWIEHAIRSNLRIPIFLSMI